MTGDSSTTGLPAAARPAAGETAGAQRAARVPAGDGSSQGGRRASGGSSDTEAAAHGCSGTEGAAHGSGGTEAASALTHVDETGAARMVDVSAKAPSARTAVATGTVRTTAEVVGLLRRGAVAKGDALAAARIAGIMGAKRTPDLVPLCHPIAISHVSVDFSVRQTSVDMTATVSTTDRTGVEMEALTAVSVAGLTLHDMIKAVDPAAVLDGVRVERKEGGKTGRWVRPADR